MVQVTHSGLDVLLKAYGASIQSLVSEPPTTDSLLSPAFNMLWSTGQSDVEGGVVKLNNFYYNHVVGGYAVTKVLHTVLFAMSWVLAAVYVMGILLPFLRVTLAENRRVAELLASLPPDVDVEGLLGRILFKNGSKPAAPREGSVHKRSADGQQVAKRGASVGAGRGGCDLPAWSQPCWDQGGNICSGRLERDQCWGHGLGALCVFNGKSKGPPCRTGSHAHTC